jgi:hypothetical protein
VPGAVEVNDWSGADEAQFVRCTDADLVELAAWLLNGGAIVARPVKTLGP